MSASDHTSADSWKRPGWNSTITTLAVPNASQALEFWTKAFNVEVLDKQVTPTGQIMHSVLRIGDTILMASDNFPEWGVNATSVGLHVYVKDVDAAFKQAVEAGAKVGSPVMDQFWGDRSGSLTDGYGIRWTLATRVKDMTPEQIKQEADKWMSGEHSHEQCDQQQKDNAATNTQ